MHGRVKNKALSEQEQLVKQLVREQKLTAFEKLKSRVLEKREKGEFDREALELIGQLLLAGAAEFYTLWNYRCEILRELFDSEKSTQEEREQMFREEIAFNEKCVMANPKSYAIYNHRCWLFEHLVPDSLMASMWPSELAFTERLLAADERNFHTWDYRRWLFKHWPSEFAELLPTWQKELEFSRSLIAKNLSNYSAWHYRAKLLQVHLDSADLKAELDLANNAIFTDPNDQSAWWFYNSLIDTLCPSESSWLVSESVMSEQLQILRDLVSLEPRNKHAKLTLVKIKRLVAPEDDVGELITLFEEVAELDPMRRNYYSDMRSSCVVDQRLTQKICDGSSLDLTDLALTSVPFTSLATAFSGLKKLDLSKNKLVRLGREIGRLVSLEGLAIDFNQLADVTSISALPGLRRLSLCHNHLVSPSILAPLKALCSLEELRLAGNDFDEKAKSELLEMFGDGCKVKF